MALREIAKIRVKPGHEDAFVAAALAKSPKIAADENCGGVEVYQGVEEPQDFIFVVSWTSIEAHESFRQSATFDDYRSATRDHVAEGQFSHYQVLGTF